MPPETGPLAKAIADLVERTGVAPADIVVIASEEVTWPDGSLGCPEPGMFYTQALVNGSLIVLEADGRHYQYHAGPDGEPFLCANPTPPASVGGGLGDT